MNYHYQFILRFEKGLLKAILSTPRSHRCADSIFYYEYIRDFEVKVGTARKLVQWTFAGPIDAKKIEKRSLQCLLTVCHV